MNLFSLTITRTDGSTTDVEAGQYAVSQGERWAARNGLRFDLDDPGRLAFTQLRVLAWAEDVRALPPAKRPGFDEWDEGIEDVEVRSAGPPDPTDPATSAG